MKKEALFFVMSCLITFFSFGQSSPDTKPPTEKLKVFEPYFGKYKQTMNFAGRKWSGTMEIKPIIKGWYIDWTILTKSDDNQIDREYHMLVTYDTTMNKYRIWRFETLPPNNNEISLSTVGTDIIIEMKIPHLDGPTGPPAIFYNRYSKPASDKIKIVSELHSPDGKVLEEVGVTTATKIK